jgi:hypothetical protein
LANVWIVCLELAANSRQIRINGSGFDKVGHVDGIEAEGFWGGVGGEGVRFAEV